MADKLRMGNEWRELKLGASFTNNKSTSFHTLKCDFKPASVDASKMATVDVGTNNQVTVTVPHLDGAGIPQTVFKGNQRPYQKECVLIIDKVTGEITLEKLSSNIQVKKTRQEPPQKPAPPPVLGPPRPPSPETLSVNNCTQRSTSRTKVASGGRRGASAKPSGTSPHRHRTSPPQATPWTVNSGQSTLASLPMIGFDDSAQPPAMMPAVQPERQSFPPLNNVREPTPLDILRNGEEEDVGVLSSSSGSSSSGSESDHSNSGQSDDQHENRHQRHLPPPSLNSLTLPNTNRRSNPEPPTNGAVNGNGNSAGNSEASMPMQLLNEDLCLSESGSDSD